MLNPDFRLLDPEPEQLERLWDLAGDQPLGYDLKVKLKSMDSDQVVPILNQGIAYLATPGIHTASDIEKCLRQISQEKGIATLETHYFGWPESLLTNVFKKYPTPRVFVLGIMDASGIWAGAIIGSQGTGVDFLGTFRLLWDDEPELASKQTFQDLPEICQAVKRRFDRSVTGLFIYHNEFNEWRNQNWSSEKIHQFLQNQTAAWYEQ